MHVEKKEERNPLHAVDVTFESTLLVRTEPASIKGTSKFTGTKSAYSRNKEMVFLPLFVVTMRLSMALEIITPPKGHPTVCVIAAVLFLEKMVNALEGEM